MDPGYSLLKVDIQCKNPKLVLVVSNKKERVPLENIIMSQCDSSTTVCYVYSKHGTMGSTAGSVDCPVRFACSFSRLTPAVSWLCLPHDVDAQILAPHSDIDTTTKLVVVLNVSNCRDRYRTSVFPDSGAANVSNPVIYSGGLVNAIEIFNRDKQSFEKVDSISVAIGGPDCLVDHCLLRHEGSSEADSVAQAFSGMKARSDEVGRRHSVKYQCILIFSCFVRRTNKLAPFVESADAAITEYELCAQYFPGVPVNGVLCEGEIFHVHNGVLKLVKGLSDYDIEGNTSIFVLLTWTRPPAE